MGYYSDLSNYVVDHRSFPNVKNVGWLDRDHAFNTGDVSEPLRLRLRQLAKAKYTNQSRGFHYCELCSEEDPRVDGVRLGSAEIWVPSSSTEFYASPDLIVHYVDAHAYVPPAEYLDALERLDIDRWYPVEDFADFLRGSLKKPDP
jgi:hypothetical protein